jgi:hypothetical protein
VEGNLMAKFELTRPKSTVIKVKFPDQWKADAESEGMFRAVLDELNAAEDEVTLIVVAGKSRPVYAGEGLRIAHDVLHHDNIGKMIVVADDPTPATTHMAAVRGERGLSPLSIIGCKTEAEAETLL